jgi:hypothetical protein
MELRQHYSFFYIMERLLEIIEDGDNQDHREKIEALHCWFHVDRFDRNEANRRLYDYARGENVFAWVLTGRRWSMKIKVQVVTESEGGDTKAAENRACLERGRCGLNLWV